MTHRMDIAPDGSRRFVADAVREITRPIVVLGFQVCMRCDAEGAACARFCADCGASLEHASSLTVEEHE